MRQKERRDLKMIELYNQGLSYQAVSDKMNTLGEAYRATRTAVAARITRMSLQGKVTRRQPSNKHVENKAKKIHNSRTVLLKSYSRIELPDWTKYGEPEDSITLMDLKNNSCKFPFESGKYCGHDSVIGSYCVKHSKICHQPDRKRA